MTNPGFGRFTNVNVPTVENASSLGDFAPNPEPPLTAPFPFQDCRTRISSRNNRAFTLLEMLSVMAIVVLVMTVAGNVVSIDKRRADVHAAIDDFSGVLQNARLEARSKSTFVWVCLTPATSNAAEGMQVNLFASRDGTGDSSPANLQPMGQRLLLKRVALKDSSTTTPDRLQQDYQSYSANTTGTTRVGNSTLVINDGKNTFSDLIVCFNPRGEAFIPGQNTPGFIEFLFSPLLDKSDSAVKSSSILLSRSTGSTQVYR